MLKNSPGKTMQFSIYPAPRKLRTHRTQLDITGRSYLKLSSGFSTQFNDAIQRFVTRCRQKFIITHGAVSATETLLTLRLTKGKTDQEAYQIATTEAGLVLSAHTETGLFRGKTSRPGASNPLLQKQRMPYLSAMGWRRNGPLRGMWGRRFITVTGGALDWRAGRRVHSARARCGRVPTDI